MQNIKQLLQDVSEFEDFVAKRGYEFLMALGCKWKMQTTPMSFIFLKDEVQMTFEECLYHDAATETICLQLDLLEMNDDQWADFIVKTKSETDAKNQREQQQKAEKEIEEKEKKFQQLKKELGYGN